MLLFARQRLERSQESNHRAGYRKYAAFEARSRMRLLLASLVGFLFLAACQPTPSAKSPGRRIVSLDYCADQFVLGLADRADILAVSPDAGAAFSYMRTAAEGLPTVRPRAEDVLALEPDLVVRSYGGGPNARAFFERAGVRVLQIGFADDLAGVRAVIRHAARGLGAPNRGERLIAGMNARFRATRVQGPSARALYLTPAGYSAGPGTLVHEVLTAAGLENFQVQRGWHPIPLESLAYETPTFVARAHFGAGANHDDAWTSFRHPVVRRTLSAVPVAVLDGATTSCGGWFVVDAVAALAALRQGLSAGHVSPQPGALTAPTQLPPSSTRQARDRLTLEDSGDQLLGCKGSSSSRRARDCLTLEATVRRVKP